jgi:hypothetical protein
MNNDNKLPKRVKRVIDIAASGQRIIKTYRLKESGEHEVIFTFMPSGRSAPPQSCIDAIEGGYLSPLGDGLFGAETSQSWQFDHGYA